MKNVAVAGAVLSMMLSIAQAETIWIEGEKPTKSTMNRHPWWYDQVKKDQLSGGDWISNFADKKPAGEAEYSVTAKEGGKFEFWVRANPTATKLSFRLNDADWKPVEFEKNARDAANIAGDGKLDLRFIAWAKVGNVELKRGANSIRFRMHSDNSNHGGLDCFVLSTEPFTPRGILKPGEIAKATASFDKDWFAFDPSADKFEASSAIDLRFLNEKFAGEHGGIAAKDGHFVHSMTGEPVRFWAVNGAAAKSREELATRGSATREVRRQSGAAAWADVRQAGRSRSGQDSASLRCRRDNESRGNLHALLNLFPAVARSPGRPRLAAGL